MKTALIAGATGLVGKQVLELLLTDDHYEEVIAITRTPLAPHPRLKNIVIDFDQLEQYLGDMQYDHIFCCLGTTMKKAGSKKAFYKVDFEYPYQLAQLGKKAGATQYLLVSALGADKNSSIYYNKVKGEVEAAVASLGYETFQVFRPSLLLGPREEARAGEDTAKWFYRVFGFLIPAKYKAVESSKVAHAMVTLAKSTRSGTYYHESLSLQGF